MPLITYNGSPKLPRIRIEEDAPAKPELFVIVTPGARPAKALERFDTGIFSNSSVLIAVIDPVKFTFFCVPYPTTTTSSKACVSSFNKISN